MFQFWHRRVKFELVAAVKHIGRTNTGGHYVTAVCSTTNGGAGPRLYDANDNTISLQTKPSIGFYSSSIVVYQRCTTEHRPPTSEALITPPPRPRPLPPPTTPSCASSSAPGSVLGKRKQRSHVRTDECLNTQHFTRAPQGLLSQTM